MGKTRKLVPVEQVDEVVPRFPDKKCDCGGRVAVDENRVPERQQKFELPKFKPEITEYQLFAGTCMKCDKVHRGKLPAGVPTGMLGPRAMAIVATYSGDYHLSKRQIEGILKDHFSMDVSLGTVSNTEGRVSDALAAPALEARAYVREQPVVHADETGHKVAGKRAWVWAGVTSFVAVFLVRMTRGTAAAKELLGEKFSGLLVSDRWSGYNWVDAARRQLCWAHLVRDFKKISERGDTSQEIADSILEYTQEMFVLWHMVKDGKRTKRWFQRKMVWIRPQIEDLLEQGTVCGHLKTQRTCKNLLKLKTALWTFVDTDDVEPTNNFAEQIIRDYVLWRKISYGTQSERGNRFVERMLTVTATCRLQKRNVLDYVTEAVSAHLCGELAPSLLPEIVESDAVNLAA